MQIVRTIVWVLILFGMLTFSFFNWDTVEVNLWENLVLETKVPVLVIVAFLLGLVPMWLYHRSVKWSLGRRIRSLEASIKSTALSHRSDETETSVAAAPATAAPEADKPVENPVEEAAEPADNSPLTPADDTSQSDDKPA